MPFKELNIDEYIENRCSSDPEFKQAWHESREETRLIGELTAIVNTDHRAKQRLSTLDEKTRKAIFKIVKREVKPSPLSFTNALDSLGFYMQIERKL